LIKLYLVSFQNQNKIRLHHIHTTSLQRAFRKALAEANIPKHVYTLRHSFATHLLEEGYGTRSVQELLGHSNVQTTMKYIHLAKKNILGVRCPLDFI